MKIIQALKKQKDEQKAIADLQQKISLYCADTEDADPAYENQEEMVKGWVQGVHDRTKEILRLRIAVQRTNLATQVEIPELKATHSIAEWIHRRRELADTEYKVWKSLTDRGLKPKAVTATGKPEDTKIYQVRRYFDPKERDKKLDVLRDEPSIIDAKLEVVNAETDLIEQ